MMILLADRDAACAWALAPRRARPAVNRRFFAESLPVAGMRAPVNLSA